MTILVAMETTKLRKIPLPWSLFQPDHPYQIKNLDRGAQLDPQHLRHIRLGQHHKALPVNKIGPELVPNELGGGRDGGADGLDLINKITSVTKVEDKRMLQIII